MLDELTVHYEGERQGINLSAAHTRAASEGAKYLFVRVRDWGDTIATPVLDDKKLEQGIENNRGIDGITLYQVDGDQPEKLSLKRKHDEFQLEKLNSSLPKELRF